ncbi:MAG TPA: hypothetical protein VJH03_14130 [Blastocatellia bacterium]|nr:hypothetical protein [Blastocatellia bacterium]
MRTFEDSVMPRRSYKWGPLLLVCAVAMYAGVLAASPRQSDNKKDDKKKKPEPYSVKRLTQGMGLYAIGPVSPDKQALLLIAERPGQAPNLYHLDLTDFSIKPPLTNLKWGVNNPQWSPDGVTLAFAGFNETASFSEIYTLELKTGKLRRLTTNAFTDKEPIFTPDGKRLLYTTDESPLPDAAFGILHIAAVAVGGGKPEYFTEDEATTIQPGLAPDGKSVLLVKVDDASGRHSLWQYGFDGKPQQSLTARKFARIHSYVANAESGSIVIWGQEQAQQEEDVYVLDFKSREVRALPDPDLPKHNPTVSPNGRRIAFIGPTGSGAQVFLFDSTSGEIQQITSKGMVAHSPAFVSNDRIVFGSDRDGEKELYLVDLAAPTQTQEKKKN